MKHKRPSLDSKQAQLGKRIAPGIWTDQDGNAHFSIPELLEQFGYEDNPHNRQLIEQSLREALKETNPQAEIREVANRLSQTYDAGGVPLYWMNEETGKMRAVVRSFVCEVQGGDKMSLEHFNLLQAYLVYVVEAPCWKGVPVAEIVEVIDRAKNAEELSTVIHRLLEFGIDPL